MMAKYEPPAFEKNDFYCPHCGVHARQYWKYVYLSDYPPSIGGARGYHEGIRVTFCNSCGRYSIWNEKKMIYPLSSTAPVPTDDMPGDVMQDYMEARSVVGQSPRSAAALLRLAVQKLMPHLGESGKNLNNDIASLVKNGLPGKMKMGLHSLRVIGNNAVHPGEIDLTDDAETATTP